MSNETQPMKRFKFYWEIRNGKFKNQLRPIIKFLTKHLRKYLPRGTAWHIINETPGAGWP